MNSLYFHFDPFYYTLDNSDLKLFYFLKEGRYKQIMNYYLFYMKGRRDRGTEE